MLLDFSAMHINIILLNRLKHVARGVKQPPINLNNVVSRSVNFYFLSHIFALWTDRNVLRVAIWPCNMTCRRVWRATGVPMPVCHGRRDDIRRHVLTEFSHHRWIRTQRDPWISNATVQRTPACGGTTAARPGTCALGQPAICS